jgi:HEAT repeat protein
VSECQHAIDRLRHPRRAVRKQAAEALVAPLCRLLEDAARDPSLRRVVARVLGEIGEPRAVEPLCRALAPGQSPELLDGVAEALGRLGDARAIPSLCQALAHERPMVREQAAQALGAIGDTRALAPLCRALEDPDGKVRRQATLALGRLGPSAAEPLCRQLRGGAPHQREAAVLALGSLRDPHAVPTLVQALADHDRDVRRGAAAALGAIGAPEAVEPLSEPLRDRSQPVRRAAVVALAQIGSPAAEALCRALCDPLPGAAEEVLDAMWAAGGAAVPAWLRALQEGEVAIRRRAAEALEQIGRRDALPVLRARLHRRTGEQDAEVLAAIRLALEQIEQTTASTLGLPRAAAPEAPDPAGRPRASEEPPLPGRRPRKA